MSEQPLPRHDHDADATIHTGEVQKNAQPTVNQPLNAAPRPRFGPAALAGAILVVVVVVIFVLMAF